MSDSEQNIVEGEEAENVVEATEEVVQEVVKPERGLIWVDLNEDQARIMPGRPEENITEDEKGEERLWRHCILLSQAVRVGEL